MVCYQKKEEVRSLLEKRLSLRTDFLITGLNGVGTVLGIFVVSGYLARSLGLDALGEYLLVRRTVTALLGVLLLGMNVALPALLARDEEKRYGDAAFALFLVGTLPLIAVASIVVAKSFMGEKVIPYLVFGTGFCALTLTYALYRGHFNMIGANLLQFTAGTVVSVLAVIAARSIDQLLVMIGIPMIALSLTAYLVRNRGVVPKRISKEITREMLAFGAVRIPSFIFQFFLLAGVPLISLSYLSLAEQAYLNAGISLVRVFLIVVGPLGIVLLPRISQAVSKGVNESLSSNLSLLIRVALFYGLMTGLVLNQLSGEILSVWLGEVTDRASGAIALLLFSIPVFVLSAVLRSPIDAGASSGYNSLIYGAGATFMALSFFLLLRMGVDPFISATAAFLSGQTVSGIGSFIVAKKLFHLQVFDLRFIMSLLITLALTMGVVISILRMTTDGVTLIVSLMVLCTAICLHFFFSRESWVVELRSTIGIR